MIDGFYLKLLLSFVIGGAWITLATVVAEKLGSKIGGIVAGAPSTIVVALAFIAWTQGPAQVFAAGGVLPLALAINCVYVVTFSFLSLRIGWLSSIVGGLLVWFLVQSLIVTWNMHTLAVTIPLGLGLTVFSYYFLEYILKIRSHEKIAVHYSAKQLLGRAVFSGGMIAFAVVMSKIGGSTWGGIFSAFPAVMTSTLVIMCTSVDVPFARAVIKPLVLSGVVNPAVFALAFRYAILNHSLPVAVMAAYAVSLVSVFLTYLFARSYLS